MSLRAFMASVPKEQELEFVVSERFLDEQGNPEIWKLRSISAAEDRKIKDSCFKYVTAPGKKQAKKEFDGFQYNLYLTASCILYPDLNNAELQNYYGAKNAVECLEKMLLPGELDNLVVETKSLNGDNSLKEKLEEAKN